MATRVSFAIPRREIEQTGIAFRRKTDDGLHGELIIRQNHVAWRPRGNEYIFEVTWEKFADFAEREGRRILPKTTSVRASKRLKART